MRRITDPGHQSRRFLVTAITTGIALLILVGIGLYGLLRGPAPGTSSRTPVLASDAPAAVPSDGNLLPYEITAGTHPERFARAVAERLFAWDTGRGVGSAAYMQPLIDIADPEEAPGLAVDLRGYFPDDATWGALRNVSTRQWITVDAVTVPASWASIVQARPGQLPPGAVAYTVTGTRHRAGVWEGQPVMDARPVSFTLFAACPDEESCRLLRLSAVDQPMQ